jgi:acyl-CoA synthetase (AMP-forming)/AMP-acid ligase II
VLGVAMRIVDEEGRQVAAGETGELLIGGDHVMAGYWSNAEATTKSLQDGWLRSGDIASTDERGYLYLLDRRADMIISGGFNIMPREIEDLLSSHRAVREVAVVGVPDREWGEAVVACVVAAAPGPDLEAELRGLCAQRLAAFKKPKRFEFLGELPRNATGKLSRKLLRDQLAGPGTGR